jgi:hypothetical protein
MIEINNLVKNVENYPNTQDTGNEQGAKPEPTQKPKVNQNENTSNSMSFMD